MILEGLIGLCAVIAISALLMLVLFYLHEFGRNHPKVVIWILVLVVFAILIAVTWSSFVFIGEKVLGWFG